MTRLAKLLVATAFLGLMLGFQLGAGNVAGALVVIAGMLLGVAGCILLDRWNERG